MSNKSIAIICFYWQGDRWREKGTVKITEDGHINYHKEHLKRAGEISHNLPSKYVNNLYQGIKRFATEPFEFICFTNQPLQLDKEIEIRPFIAPSSLGVLPRLYMFSEDSGLFGRQVLALDIDIIIVGSLTDIMSYRGPFCARSKFKPGMQHLLDGDVISFQAGSMNAERLWINFIKNRAWAENMTRGRERFWYRHAIGDKAERWDIYAPKQIVSYKRHVLPLRGIPKGARIISCHGIPRPHEINTTWRRKFWD